MVVTGALFAAGGIMAGAVVGAEMASCGGDDWCDLGGAVLGALVGEVVMLPIGVHMSGDQATYGSKLRGSAAMMLGGLILAAPTGGLSLLFIPPAQLWYTIALEQRAARRNQGLAMR